MVKSKVWNWNLVSEDDKFWNSPSPEIYFLSENWKGKKFTEFLDIGCGLGRNCIFMAKKKFIVSTFDLSNKSVESTKLNAAKQGVKFNDIRVADMLNIPYPNDSFDCVLAMNVISHTDKVGFDRILKEIKRVLKVGGEVYFTVGSKESFWFNNPNCIYVDDFTKIRVEDGPENGIPHFYIDDNDCKNLFNDFQILQIQNIRELTQYGNFSPHYHIWLKKTDEF